MVWVVGLPKGLKFGPMLLSTQNKNRHLGDTLQICSVVRKEVKMIR